MRDEQFSELMGKLEEIRCGIIDIETALENKPEETNFDRLRGLFFDALELKTGWGRNEIKTLFDESCLSILNT